MPPPVRVTKEQIVDAATALVRREGPAAINARAVAAEVGCSTQPIFSNFDSVDSLRKAVCERALALYTTCIRREMENVRYPLYKATGMGYVQFAEQEPQLFRLLFMTVNGSPLQGGWNRGIETLMKQTGMTREEAEAFHLEMWVFVHGIAVMIATNYLVFDHGQISAMMTDVYMGLRQRYYSKREDAI